MLCVDGKGVFKKLVTTSNNWADNEFKKESTLFDLEKEKEFTEKNFHLSGVPSEFEVKENGVVVDDMFAIQIRKIEQLFKYSFLLNAQVKKMTEENGELKTQNEILMKELAAIKEKLEKLGIK